MSGARAPAGVDPLDKDEEALLEQMRADGDGDASTDLPQPSPVADTGPAPASDTEIESADDTDPSRPATGTVSIKALHEERRLRREAQAEVERARARFEERLKVLGEVAESVVQSQRPAAPKAEEIAIPDYDTDPIGHLRARQQVLERQVADKDAIITGLSQGQQAQDAASELRNWGLAQENAFVQGNPAENRPPVQDYPQAMAFLKASRHAELEAIGYTDPAARERQVLTDITGIAMVAKQQNANFAERLYNAATARGYQKVAPAAVAAPTPAATSTLPPLVPASPRPPAQSMQRRELARENSTSLSNVGGSPAPRALTPAQIADLSDGQFDAYVAQLNGAQKRELFGD